MNPNVIAAYFAFAACACEFGEMLSPAANLDRENSHLKLQELTDLASSLPRGFLANRARDISCPPDFLLIQALKFQKFIDDTHLQEQENKS